jgi:pimeloyl-ACP methyl ester carboxylesterase
MAPELATAVFHGDKDPLFQLPHGKALAAEIPAAHLVVLPNTGHEFPSRNWPTVLKALPR